MTTLARIHTDTVLASIFTDLCHETMPEAERTVPILSSPQMAVASAQQALHQL